jgi:hypothetical protein
MKYFSWALLIGLLVMAYSCGDSSGSEQTAAEAEKGSSQAAATGEKLYPSIPKDTLEMLFAQCDYIDYVFYYTNFSVNQSNQQDIRSALSHIAQEVPAIIPSCKPIGRLFYQVRGDNRLVADLYLDKEAGCVYYLFMENGKPAYANRIMPAGISFLENILSRTKTMAPQ